MMYLAEISDKGQVAFEAWEVQRINRIRIAERLHVTPGDVDRMRWRDVQDCLDVWKADEMVEEHRQRTRR